MRGRQGVRLDHLLSQYLLRATFLVLMLLWCTIFTLYHISGHVLYLLVVTKHSQYLLRATFLVPML